MEVEFGDGSSDRAPSNQLWDLGSAVSSLAWSRRNPKKIRNLVQLETSIVTIEEFNVDSKAECVQLNLPVTPNGKGQQPYNYRYHGTAR